jgi:hypothetical protein
MTLGIGWKHRSAGFALGLSVLVASCGPKSSPHADNQPSGPAESRPSEDIEASVRVRVKVAGLDHLPDGEARTAARERWSLKLTVEEVVRGPASMKGESWVFLIHSPAMAFGTDVKVGGTFLLDLPGQPEIPYRGKFKVVYL